MPAWYGARALLRTSPSRWFATTAFADTLTGRRLLGSLAEADPVGYAACCDALATYDVRSDLAGITAPTLVVAGSQDVATPVEHAQELAVGIPNAVLEVLDCGHLAAERPQALQAVLTAHLIAFHTGHEKQTPLPERAL
ncbi:alpha/beta hydrolase [Streptomyces mutabilis]|uniref:alpha/beta hydrolase n=1 Tax=Streptomyces mutabilis TaxID=67332 RepID=UPI000ADEC6DF|nr:alpha/beta hydrolase [Streptomyces mutabilis]